LLRKLTVAQSVKNTSIKSILKLHHKYEETVNFSEINYSQGKNHPVSELKQSFMPQHQAMGMQVDRTQCKVQ